MTISPSAVSRVIGWTIKYKDLRGGNARYLPQRIAVFAQGQTGSVFPATKWEVTSLPEAGAKYGFRSAIYLMLRELLPVTGDGVGVIPITVYPLGDAVGSTAAAANVTPSGTPTKQTTVRARVGGYFTPEFVVPAGALATAANLTRANKLLREAIDSITHSPLNTTYTYGTVTASALTGTGNGTIDTFTTSGNPKPGVWRLLNVTVVANGGVWSLTDPDGIVVSTTLTMTPGVGGVTALSAGGLGFSLTDGTTDFGLGAFFDITVPATNVLATAAWKGTTGNDIKIEIFDSIGEITWAITQPAGGAVNPGITTALAQVGGVWETLILNGLNIADTVTLDEYQAFGEGRYVDTVKKPCAVITGNTAANVDTATAVVMNRQTDKINIQVPAPGSPNLPFVVAARHVARIAVVANNSPARNYTGQKLTGLYPGTDAEQWDYLKREIAVNRGSSTVEVVDKVIQISDVMTCYRPTGEEPPAYRYLVDIIKIWNILYNLRLLFEAEDWAGAPLVPDSQAVAEPTAKKPRMAKAQIAALMDSLSLLAIIADPNLKTPALPTGAKGTIFANIDSINPKRLNIGGVFPISGNSQIIDGLLEWGFYFGQVQAAA